MLGLRALGDCSGGIERHVEELACRLAGQGVNLTVFCRARYNTLGETVHCGVTLKNSWSHDSKHLEAITNTAAIMPRVLTGFDIVHFHAVGPALLSWVPRLANRKVVVTVHGLDYLRDKWNPAAKLILRAGAWCSATFPHATIVVSKGLQDHYRKAYDRQAAHIPNGVTPGVHRPLDLLSRRGLTPNKYILFLGRLVPEKGAHTLIEAFKALPTDLKLVIAGGALHNDPYLTDLSTLAASDPRILLTGPLYGPEKEEALSNARLLTLPSTLEGMPLVMLEAMSHACPVLASDIPECREVVADSPPNSLARFFPSRDPRALRQALQAALDDPGLPAMGQRARDHVLARYDWQAIAAQTLQVYQRLLPSS